MPPSIKRHPRISVASLKTDNYYKHSFPNPENPKIDPFQSSESDLKLYTTWVSLLNPDEEGDRNFLTEEKKVYL